MATWQCCCCCRVQQRKRYWSRISIDNSNWILNINMVTVLHLRTEGLLIVSGAINLNSQTLLGSSQFLDRVLFACTSYWQAFQESTVSCRCLELDLVMIGYFWMNPKHCSHRLYFRDRDRVMFKIAEKKELKTQGNSLILLYFMSHHCQSICRLLLRWLSCLLLDFFLGID